ncbi:hypothetical protein [Acetivibrio ethanolgignens]|nr:hypothetical protein [Acetivibrio ethanolgignens]
MEEADIYLDLPFPGKKNRFSCKKNSLITIRAKVSGTVLNKDLCG